MEETLLKQNSATHLQKYVTHKNPIVQVPESANQKDALECFSSFCASTRQTDATTPDFSSLPTYAGPLIGREQDLQALSLLLCSSEVRLVTLIGMGGVGKTRLALHTATELHNSFIDGVYFVSLSSTLQPDQVLTAIALALALEKSDEQPLLETVKHALCHKRSLLLVDTMEHVISAALDFTYLLTACSHLKILVTSRRRLDLQEEYIFPVAPLTLPDLTTPFIYENLSQYTAIALFVQRVQTLYPNFQLTKNNMYLIAEICARLAGLPLALELAAARIKLLAPKELLLQLRDSSTWLVTLTNEMRNVPLRHQTLDQNMEWSFSLLTRAERYVFQILSVFENDYTFTAIEKVCRAANKEVQNMPLWDIVRSLVDQNLLQVRWSEEKDEPCFMMPEMISVYAQERLKKSETEVTRPCTVYASASVEGVRSRTTSSDQDNYLRGDMHRKENLTTREFEVLRLIAQGLSDAQIAEQLTISSRTVNFHLTSIYRKLQVSSRSAATHYVFEHHLF